MQKPKPCTAGPDHKWAFVKNFHSGRQNGGTYTSKTVGVYKCLCGAKKHGDPQFHVRPFNAEQSAQVTATAQKVLDTTLESFTKTCLGCGHRYIHTPGDPLPCGH